MFANTNLVYPATIISSNVKKIFTAMGKFLNVCEDTVFRSLESIDKHGKATIIFLVSTFIDQPINHANIYHLFLPTNRIFQLINAKVLFHESFCKIIEIHLSILIL